jgi:hypothetical protein|tara:strand:- start:269 stop:739 length:471 start_codon:yes stop_codon:yes gene_type:complete
MQYDFKTQFVSGKADEAKLDKFFSRWYEIIPVNRDAERKGVDRIFTHKDDGRKYVVEYKADSKAAETGNVFIETISVDTAKKPGWAYTSYAQLLIIYIPPTGQVYVCHLSVIKGLLEAWKKQYKTTSAQNDGYKTWGILVPLHELHNTAWQVRIIS